MKRPYLRSWPASGLYTERSDESAVDTAAVLVRTLGRIGGPLALQALVRSATQDASDPRYRDLRLAAIAALANPVEGGQETLADLGLDPDPEIASAARRALSLRAQAPTGSVEGRCV